MMIELMFRHVHNTFLQGGVVDAVGAALLNTQHKDLYLRHVRRTTFSAPVIMDRLEHSSQNDVAVFLVFKIYNFNTDCSRSIRLHRKYIYNNWYPGTDNTVPVTVRQSETNT